ncbi:hypothetical protein ABMX48_36345 [Streptomyces cavourensis]
MAAVLVFQDIDAVEVLLWFFERRHVLFGKCLGMAAASTVGKEFLQILALQVSIPFRQFEKCPGSSLESEGGIFSGGESTDQSQATEFGNAQEGLIGFQMRKKGSAGWLDDEGSWGATEDAWVN